MIQNGEELAERFKTAVKNTLARIASEPTLGRKQHFRSGIADLRSLPVDGPFDKILLFYRIDESEVEIWRLMHGARHLSRWLLEPND